MSTLTDQRAAGEAAAKKKTKKTVKRDENGRYVKQESGEE